MLTGLNSAQLEMLLLHELAHIQRHDYLINFLQTMIEILLFFHPAVAWISKQMRNEREYCSDDIAVQHCGDPIAYAHTLTDTATLLCVKHKHHHTIPVMAMTASGGDLKQRVIRLVNHHCSSNNNTSKWFAASSIILTIFLILSQQLLTQPTLNLWNTQPSWEKSTLPSLISITNNANINGSTSSEEIKVSKSSIAQQLLLSEQNQSILDISPVNNLSFQDIKTAQKLAINSQPLSIDNEVTPLKTTIKQEQIILSTLPASISVKHSKVNDQPLDNLKITKSLTLPKLSAVELAFDRTDSESEKNPYAENIAQLSSQQAIVSPTSSIDLIPSIYPYENSFLTSTKQIVLNDTNNKQSTLPTRLAAKQLTSISPVYPNMAKRKGIELEVKVNFTIDVNGHIKNIQFTPQNKINYFKNAILIAMKKWQFSPAKKNDKPIESQMSKIFSFSLQSA